MLFYLSIPLCYLLGGIPFGLLIGRLNGVDIRQHGSGNIGATNVWRVCGRRWGIACFTLDALKGLLPVLGAAGLAAGRVPPGRAELVTVLAVFATVAGHVWSPYLRFKGGKGVATSAGAVLAVAPWPLLIALAVWGLVFAASRYVSLASIVAAIALPFAGVGVNLLGESPRYRAPVLALLVLLAVLAVIRHRSNITRLLNGTENRMGRKDTTDENSSSQ